MRVQLGSTPTICIPYDAGIILVAHMWRAIKNGVMSSDWGTIDGGQGAPSTYAAMAVTLTSGATDTLGQLVIQYTDDVTNAGQLFLEVVDYDPSSPSSVTPADITAIAQEVWNLADGIEPGTMPKEVMMALAAILAGEEVTAAGVTSFLNWLGTKTRVQLSASPGGNRGAATFDFS